MDWFPQHSKSQVIRHSVAAFLCIPLIFMLCAFVHVCQTIEQYVDDPFYAEFSLFGVAVWIAIIVGAITVLLLLVSSVPPKKDSQDEQRRKSTSL